MGWVAVSWDEAAWLLAGALSLAAEEAVPPQAVIERARAAAQEMAPNRLKRLFMLFLLKIFFAYCKDDYTGEM